MLQITQALGLSIHCWPLRWPPWERKGCMQNPQIWLGLGGEGNNLFSPIQLVISFKGTKAWVPSTTSPVSQGSRRQEVKKPAATGPAAGPAASKEPTGRDQRTVGWRCAAIPETRSPTGRRYLLSRATIGAHLVPRVGVGGTHRIEGLEVEPLGCGRLSFWDCFCGERVPFSVVR